MAAGNASKSPNSAWRRAYLSRLAQIVRRRPGCLQLQRNLNANSISWGHGRRCPMGRLNAAGVNCGWTLSIEQNYPPGAAQSGDFQGKRHNMNFWRGKTMKEAKKSEEAAVSRTNIMNKAWLDRELADQKAK